MSIESAVHFGAPRIKKHAPSTRGKGPRACNRTDISLIMNAPISRSSTDIFSKRTKKIAKPLHLGRVNRVNRNMKGRKSCPLFCLRYPDTYHRLTIEKNDKKDGWFLLLSEDRLLMFELGLLKIYYFFCIINQKGPQGPFLE